MKKFASLVAASILLASCSNNTVKIAEHKDYVQPEWYVNCKDIDTETDGWKFWSSTEYYYSCGSSMSGFESAANIKATHIAKRNMADRLNGVINSGSKLELRDSGTADQLSSTTKSETIIYNKISDTALRHYAKTENYTYKRGGNYHAFVMVKLSRPNVDAMIEEAIALQKQKSL